MASRGEGGRFTQIEYRGEGEKAGEDETAAGLCWVAGKNSNGHSPNEENGINFRTRTVPRKKCCERDPLQTPIEMIDFSQFTSNLRL